MSKRITLSEEAYKIIMAHKRAPTQSLSEILLRFVPPRIRTLRDLEKHLSNLHGPVIPDLLARDRLRRKRRIPQQD